MKRRRTRTVGGIFTAALLALVAAVPAQSAAISGQIVERSNGTPVAGAIVYLFPPGDSTITDAHGRFTFGQLPSGHYVIEAMHPDFEPMVLSGQDLTNDSAIECVLQLTRRTAAGADTVVRQEISKVQTTLDVLSGAVAGREAPGISQGLNEDRSGAHFNQQGIDRRSKPVTPTPAPKYIPPSEYDDYYGLPPFDMYFQNYGTNRFVDTRRDRLSTFAADVDDASYSLARQYLNDGYLPPRDAIRIEEFVNHFDYNYPSPAHSKFQVVTGTMPSPFDDSTTILSIGIKGREIPRRERKPVNLTLVIDVSGSMGYDNRIELVKYALRELIGQLGREDRVGMVTYGSGARLVLEPIGATSRREIEYQIDMLRPGGSTNAEAGLRTGYTVAQRQYVPGHNNLILLFSDGVANVGLTRAEDLMETIQDRAHEGITLHAFGVGMGNYNDVLLEKLALQGNGKYAYINDRAEARRQLVTNFVSTMEILGRDVKIQVEFDPKAVRSYRLLGYENRAVEDSRFRDNQRDGGEIGAGHEVTAVYELVLAGSGSRSQLGTIALRWKGADGREVSELNQPIRQDKRNNRGQCVPTLRLALTSAKFAEKLKDTPYVRDLSFAELYEFASALAEDKPSDQIIELLDLIRTAGGRNIYHTKR